MGDERHDANLAKAEWLGLTAPPSDPAAVAAAAACAQPVGGRKYAANINTEDMFCLAMPSAAWMHNFQIEEQGRRQHGQDLLRAMMSACDVLKMDVNKKVLGRMHIGNGKTLRLIFTIMFENGIPILCSAPDRQPR